MKRAKKIVLFAIIFALAASSLSAGFVSSASNYQWAGAWGSPAIDGGPMIYNAGAFERNNVHLRDTIPVNSTVRTVFTTSLGGSKIRLKFSNYFGEKDVTLSEVTIAKTGETDDVVLENTITDVTFNGGRKSVTIAPGNEIYTDDVAFKTTALDKLSVSVYYENTTPIYTEGLYGGVSYLASSLGNKTHDKDVSSVAVRLDFTASSVTYHSIPFLTRLDVYADNAYSVALFSDSTLADDTYIYLTKKVLNAGIKNVGFVASGVIGNRLLYDGAGILGLAYGESALKRAKRDAFDVAGVRYVIVKIGINDILHPMERSMRDTAPYASENDVINGYKELGKMAKDYPGIRMSLCTRTPYKGYSKNFFGREDLTWTQESETMLENINSWIKYSSGDYFDSVIDLDVMRDPNDKNKLRDQMTSDGINFSTNGQIAFADIVPESCYGVSKEITDVADVLKVDPYKAPAPTQSDNNGGGNSGGIGSGVGGILSGIFGNGDSEDQNSGNGNSGNQSSGGNSSGGNAQNQSSGGAQSANPNINPGVVVPSVPAGGSSGGSAGAEQVLPQIENANQIEIDDDDLNVGAAAGVVNGGAVTDTAPKKSYGGQLAGFIILAVVGIAIVAVSGYFISKLDPQKSPSSPTRRQSYGRTKQKSKI